MAFFLNKTTIALSDWEGLPHNLLDDILKKLDLLCDYIRFGAVCVSWRSAWEFNNIKRNAVSRHHQPPMLLIPASTDEHVWRIYDVASKEFMGREFYLPRERDYKGSSHGWLLAVGSDWSARLYRPFSMTNKDDACVDRHTIRLPELIFYPFIFRKTLITADPVANPNECVVMRITSGGLAFLRLGRDSSWTWLTDLDFKEIADAVILGGNRVYAIKSWGNNGSMISFEISDSITTVDEVAPVIPSCPTFEGFFFTCHRYLVRSPCSDDLWQVERYVSWCSISKLRRTKLFRVFRFAGKDNGWVRVTRLEDTYLFVGDSSSVSVKCSRFSGYRSNCVYFTHDMNISSYYLGPRRNKYSDLGIYDLGTNNFELHYSLDLDSFDYEFKSPIWVVPTF